jgi:hypothetical protein
VDREVDAAGTPKPHPKSLVKKAVPSDATTKKKRIIMSDDESDDDVPLVSILVIELIIGETTSRQWIKCLVFLNVANCRVLPNERHLLHRVMMMRLWDND